MLLMLLFEFAIVVVADTGSDDYVCYYVVISGVDVVDDAVVVVAVCDGCTVIVVEVAGVVDSVRYVCCTHYCCRCCRYGI